MFHSSLRCPSKFDKSLWPLAMSYAIFMHNHTPRRLDSYSPMELWTGSKSTHSQLQNCHPWGCPTYVLDPRLQDGHKIPKWEPQSRQGLHLGWSPLHASNVPLILNLTTRHVSPQFHVVFDDWFSTISTKEKGLDDIEDRIVHESSANVAFHSASIGSSSARNAAENSSASSTLPSSARIALL